MGTVLEICKGGCQAVVSLGDVQVKSLNELLPSVAGQRLLLLLVSEVLGILVLLWFHEDT